MFLLFLTLAQIEGSTTTTVRGSLNYEDFSLILSVESSADARTINVGVGTSASLICDPQSWSTPAVIGGPTAEVGLATARIAPGSQSKIADCLDNLSGYSKTTSTSDGDTHTFSASINGTSLGADIVATTASSTVVALGSSFAVPAYDPTKFPEIPTQKISIAQAPTITTGNTVTQWLCYREINTNRTDLLECAQVDHKTAYDNLDKTTITTVCTGTGANLAELVGTSYDLPDTEFGNTLEYVECQTAAAKSPMQHKARIFVQINPLQNTFNNALQIQANDTGITFWPAAALTTAQKTAKTIRYLCVTIHTAEVEFDATKKAAFKMNLCGTKSDETASETTRCDQPTDATHFSTDEVSNQYSVQTKTTGFYTITECEITDKNAKAATVPQTWYRNITVSNVAGPEGPPGPAGPAGGSGSPGGSPAGGSGYLITPILALIYTII